MAEYAVGDRVVCKGRYGYERPGIVRVDGHYHVIVEAGGKRSPTLNVYPRERLRRATAEEIEGRFARRYAAMVEGMKLAMGVGA